MPKLVSPENCLQCHHTPLEHGSETEPKVVTKLTMSHNYVILKTQICHYGLRNCIESRSPLLIRNVAGDGFPFRNLVFSTFVF